LGAIAYGGGQFVAVGDAIMTSTDDGVTWVRRDAGSTNRFLSGLAYGDGQFAAFGEYSTENGQSTGISTILTSADGVNWVERWSGATYPLGGITYGNSVFAAVGCCPSTILTSTNGVNWNERHQDFFGRVAYGYGQFVLVGDGIMTSTDAVNWRQAFSGPFPCVDCSLSAIAYGNGRFAALGSVASTNQAHAISLASSDGVNWVVHQSLPRDSYPPPQAIAYGNGTFVAAGFFALDLSRGGIQTSRDGLTWSPLQVIAPWEFRGIAFGNGRFVAVGGFGGPTGEILQSGPIINLSVALNAGSGLLSLSLEGPTGIDYTIQGSTDLISWSDVTKVTNTQSSKVILESLPATSKHQFYRASAQ
jgi:hypothetical protein